MMRLRSSNVLPMTDGVTIGKLSSKLISMFEAIPRNVKGGSAPVPPSCQDLSCNEDLELAIRL